MSIIRNMSTIRSPLPRYHPASGLHNKIKRDKPIYWCGIG